VRLLTNETATVERDGAVVEIGGVDDTACVRCFACTEICPTAAIDNVSPPLVRLLSRGR
jgi:ferredoxin